MKISSKIFGLFILIVLNAINSLAQQEYFLTTTRGNDLAGQCLWSFR